jgi:hypothetical protein
MIYITWNNTIKEYFRPYDIEHMLQVQPQIDLGNYDSVKDNAVLIYQWVSTKRMPPGNPWIQEWIDNFKQWTEAGFPQE